MAMLTAKKWPQLKAAWDEYGFNTTWENVVDAKIRADGQYVVFLLKSGRTLFELVDIAGDGCGNWDVQNDGSEQITMAQWERLEIVPDCDWYKYPDEDAMVRLEHDELVEIENTKYRDVFLIYQEGYEDSFGQDNLLKCWLESQAYANVKASMKGKKKK